MTEVLWLLTWLPLALTAVSLPAPRNISVTLNQSGYMLRWEPGAGTPNGTSFSVHTSKKKHPFISVSGCQQVQNPLTCNLTETFGDLVGSFDIQVKAHLGNRSSKPTELKEYKPMAHLPLPKLNVTACYSKLCLRLRPPYSRFQSTYDTIEYQLRIESSNTDKHQILKLGPLESRENLTDLVPGRDYCVSIRFNYGLIQLFSNFSQPECISVQRLFSSDIVVSAVLSSLVMIVIAFFALLFGTGFICLKRSPMPSVLTSISHLEEVKVSSCGEAPTSLLNVRPMAPPAGKRTSSSSEDSDEESCTENSGISSSGANYALRQGANLLSSTSSSSSSSSSKPEPPPYRTPDSQLEVLVVIEPRPAAEQKLDSLEKKRTEEEEAAVNIGQEVNLLTLTFGCPEEEEQEEEEEEEEEEEGCLDVLDELSALAAPLVQPPQPADDAAASCCTDEAYDDSDYMCRKAM